MGSSHKDLENGKEPPKNNDVGSHTNDKGFWASWEEFPKTVFAIFGNEFCERFSYYGMRTVLTLYVANILGYSDRNSIALFHGFIVLCYSSPVLGSILADGYIGKYHTILWISLFYACGNIVLAIAATYDIGSSVHPGLDLTGLIIIGLGTGGIKPCVSPFGGDQFRKGQERLLEAFFAVFYFSINAGALISSFITPMLRVMGCQGRDTCYPAAFGMPAALMVVSVICFVIGGPWYRKFPPKENVIFEVLKVIHIAIRNKRKFSTERGHWLEHYLDDHECHLDAKCRADKCHKIQYVQDIKAFLRQCVMCVPMPVFWALYDQQGSVWVLQAVAMNGQLWKGANLLPDQMPTLNAALILIFLPVFEFGVYPLVRKCGINPTPLRRMTVGGFMIAGCFIISMFVQFAVQKTLPILPHEGTSNIGFLNALPCNITVTSIDNHTTRAPFNISSSGYQTLMNIPINGKHQVFNWRITSRTPGCVPQIPTVATDLQANKAMYTVLNNKGVGTYVSNMKKAETGEGQFKLSLNYFMDSNFTDYGGVFYWCRAGKSCIPKYSDDFEAVPTAYLGASSFHELKPGRWHLYYNNVSISGNLTTTGKDPWWSRAPWKEGIGGANRLDTGMEFEIEAQGGIYALAITNSSTPNTIQQSFFVVAGANTLSIMWQVPQYIVVTAAEILFSVTGLEFSYSQAPLTMKSVVGAVWLLTNAGGDLLVLAIEESGAFPNLAYEQLAFAIIMAVVMVVFMCLAIFWYEYAEFIQHEDEEEEVVEETGFKNDKNGTVEKKDNDNDKGKEGRRKHRDRSDKEGGEEGKKRRRRHKQTEDKKDETNQNHDKDLN